MTELPARIKDVLRDPTDDLSTERALRRMLAARLAAQRSQRSQRARLLYLGTAVLVIGGLYAVLRRPPEREVEAPAPAVAPTLPPAARALALADGAEPSLFAAPKDGAPLVYD